MATSTTPELARHTVRAYTLAPALLRWWHLTSLDAPTVAVVWTLGFAWAAHVALPLWVPVGIALGAWAAYIGDRLLDVWMDARSPKGPLRERHHFHWRHRAVFAPVAIVAAVLGLTLVLGNMPVAARGRNAALAAAAAFYFAAVHNPWRGAWRPRLRIPKELMVALLFTAACATPSWARIESHSVARIALAVPVVVFIALAWLNCHAIEVWESNAHRTRIRRIALALAGVAVVAGAAMGTINPRFGVLMLAAAVSAALLALLDRLKERMTPIALRAAADLVLLTPIALLWLR